MSKKIFDKDIILYLAFQTELKLYFNEYKTNIYKKHKTMYKELILIKKRELEAISERLRKRLNIISITKYFDVK